MATWGADEAAPVAAALLSVGACKAGDSGANRFKSRREWVVLLGNGRSL